MTYPQYPQAPAPQPYPQYPQAPAPQPYPQVQTQPMPPQYPTAPAPAPTAKGSLDDFFDQPSGGGKILSWKDKPIGTTYAGIVSREITNGDVRQVTSPQGIPQTYRDGRLKFEMLVPLIVQPTPEFPDGEARWVVRGQARDELARAMKEAGAPEGPPEAGAGIQVTLVQRRPSGAGNNPANIVQVHYVRPQGATSGQTTPPVQQQQQPQPQQPAPAPAPVQQVPAQPQPQQQQPVQPVQQAPQPPGDLSPEQQELLARLTNQQG